MAETRNLSPLLERERETSLLEHAWRDAVAGHGSAWLICAEAGGGKTRLIAEFSAGVGRDRTRWGAAEPVAPPDPYLAVTRAITGFALAASRAVTVESAVTQLAEIRAPLLLVLDDLHFADEGTVAVLVRLSEAASAHSWLVLAAFRPDEGPPALRAAATEIVAQGTARRLNLSPLSREAVARVVATVRRAAAANEEVDTIYRDSGGNPWFTEALARGNGAISAARDRIALRLERLESATPGAFPLLAAIAPATRPLPHAVVAQLRGGDSTTLRRTLAQLRDGGLLQDSEDGWQFRHELLRRSILEMLLAVERRDAHRALAEALTGEPGSTPQGSAAELAMHFAAAGDARAVRWSLQAAEEAHAVDAHTEALAQAERALSFDLAPERRQLILRIAAREAHDLGRDADLRRLAEEALAIEGGEPEIRASLHQLAARAARSTGHLAGDEAHLTAAERLLEDRPPSPEAASIATALAARAALDVQPQRLQAAAERALRLSRALPNEGHARYLEAQVKVFLGGSLLDSGDPAGLTTMEEVNRLCAEHRLPAGLAANCLVNAYVGCVFSLFHRDAAGLHGRAVDAITRHELGWMSAVTPHRALEHAQRGRYAEARATLAAIDAGALATIEQAIFLYTRVLCEARGGSLDRARALLAAPPLAQAFQPAAVIDLAHLEVGALAGEAELGVRAQWVYETMVPRQYARVAGVAAVALARAGCGAPPLPEWLAAASPLRVLWEWAEALQDHNAHALSAVARQLGEMDCPYEAATALLDAGELSGAYRAFRALDAVHAREQTATLLRAAGRPIPRRTRAAIAIAGLTDTERAVSRLVTDGLSNPEVAAALGISARTVATHLTRIYAKVGCDGRTALALWWSRQSGEPVR